MVREIHYYPELGCYVVRWLVDLTTDAMATHWRALLADPDYSPDHASLHDLRERGIAGEYEGILESRDVYQRDVAPKVGNGRVAILVDNAAAFGSGRQLTMMLGLEEDTLVTYSEAEAKRWIGLGEDHALPYVVSGDPADDSAG